MENFKSPTIELAGGPGYKIELQLVHVYNFVNYYSEHVWDTKNVVVHHFSTVLLVEF
jgi:hypothetical protein